MHARLARMVQPETLKTDAYLPWSRGRGNDVWAMLRASAAGDLDAVEALVARDPQLAECSYEYLTPIRFAVRDNRGAVVDFLLEHGVSPAYEAGESLVTIARDRGYSELTALLESALRTR